MRPLTLYYVNAHVDDINTAIDTPAHWLLDIIASDQVHEFFAGVRLLIFALRFGLDDPVRDLVSVYSFRAFCVMRRAQVNREAIDLADCATPLAKENMMFVDHSMHGIVAMDMHAQPAMSVFQLHDAGGMALAFLLALWFWVFDHSCFTSFNFGLYGFTPKT